MEIDDETKLELYSYLNLESTKTQMNFLSPKISCTVT